MRHNAGRYGLEFLRKTFLVACFKELFQLIYVARADRRLPTGELGSLTRGRLLLKL